MKEQDSLGYRLIVRRRAAHLDRSIVADVLNVPQQVVYEWEADKNIPLGTYREHLFELFPDLDRSIPSATHGELRQQLYDLSGKLSLLELQALADFARVYFLGRDKQRAEWFGKTEQLR